MKRKKLKVDLNELVFAMEMGDNMERSGYFDTVTGAIIDMPDDIIRAVERRRNRIGAGRLGRGACGEGRCHPER